MIRRILLTLLVSLLAILAGSAWLLGTESGNKRLLGLALGEQLQYDYFSGTLLGDLEIQHLEYHDAQQSLKLESLKLSWEPTALLEQLVHIKSLQIRGIEYSSLQQAETTGTSEPAQELPLLPLAVRIEQLEIDGLVVRNSDDSQQIKRIAISASGHDNDIEIAFLQVSYDVYEAELKGRVSLLENFPFSLQLNWHGVVPELGPASGEGRLSGDLKTVQLEHNLLSPFALATRGQVVLNEAGPDLDLQGDWQQLQWPLQEPVVQSASGTYHVQGPVKDLSLQAVAELLLPNTGTPAIKADLNTQVSEKGLRNLRLGVSEIGAPADSAVTLKLSGDVDLQGNEPVLALQGEWQQLRWPLQEPVVQSASGTYQVSGPLQNLSLQAAAELLLPNTGTPAIKADLDTLVSEKGLRNLQLGVTEIGAPAESAVTLKLSGDVDLQGSEPLLALQGEWQRLRWPLLEAAQFNSPAGSFKLDGPVSAMQLDTRTKLRFPQGEAPPLEAQLRGLLGSNDLQDMNLSIQLLGGTTLTTGKVQWAPEVSWDLAVAAEALDPAQHWPDWPGKLAMNASVKGGINDQGPWLDAVLKGLSGKLHEQAIDASGQAHYDSAGINLRSLQLFSGPNRLEVEGKVGDRLDLGYALNAPDLAAFWPALKGRIEADGRLGGSQSAPEVSARIKAGNLAYAELGVQQIDANLIWKQGQANGELHATGISSSGLNARVLSLQIDGSPEQHRLNLLLDAEEMQINAALEGGWQAPFWRGRLEYLQIEREALGAWQTEAAASLQAGAEKFSLQDFCLVQDATRLCANSEWTPTDSLIDAQLSTLPLARLLPWLPEEIDIEGSLDAAVHLSGALDALRGDASVSLQQASLLLEPEAEDPIRLDLSDGTVNLSLAPDKNQARVHVQIGTGEISAEASIAAFTPDQPIPLAGRITAQVPDLKPLGLLLSAVSDVQGELNADIALGGFLRQPELQGNIVLAKGAVHIPQLGLSLQSIRLIAKNEGLDRLILEGDLTSGGGQLNLKGDLLLDPEQGWPLKLNLQGESVQVVQLPEAVAYASPNLDIALQDKQLSIRGELGVPRAQIEIRELPSSAVTLSDDEIIIGLDESSSKPLPLRVDAEVRVNIGKEVHFSGFGLNTRVQGAVDVQSRDGRTLARGELSLQDGSYKAYGQDLTIEQGRFLFNGPPQNPNLDVRVTRQSLDGNVTAILGVSGNLNKPQAKVSSRPALTEEEALSYLITGKGLTDSGPGKAAILRQVIAAQGLDKGQEILDRIGSNLGIDEVSLQEGDLLEDTSLLLGKYLSPDLYVSYAVGLFDNSGSLLTRYRLTKRLRLEVKSGVHQSMDVIYDVER